MPVQRSRFFSLVRHSPFGGRLSGTQVSGLNTILDCWLATDRHLPDTALSYVLATAFHETAATMRPVRETLAASDADAMDRLEKAFRAGRMPSVKTPYWRLDEDGKSWFGRGYVQLTHRRNYLAMSRLTGIDLLAMPGRAMEPDVAARILIDGMCCGSFTGWHLKDCFGPSRADWLGARKIINGTDRAELVAGHARSFRAALEGGAE